MQLQTLWIVVGAVAAVLCEAMFRAHKGYYDQVFPLAMVLALITNFGVWNAMQGATSLVSGLIMWTFVTGAMRIGFTLGVLREPVSAATWTAFGLIVVAQVVQRVWR